MSSNGSEREPETDLWFSGPYIEIIPEVVSRYDGRRLRSSLRPEPLKGVLVDGLAKLGSLKVGLQRNGPLKSG